MIARGASPSRHGFTVVEVLVVVVLGSLLLGSIYELMMSQSRIFGRQQEITDVQNSLRGTAALLAHELRSVAPEDIYVAGDSSVTLRSYTGAGVVCEKDATSLRLSLAETSGDFTATTSDSVLVLALGDATGGDEAWRASGLAQVGDASTVGVTACSWPDTPDMAVRLTAVAAADTAGLTVGGPVVVFQAVE